MTQKESDMEGAANRDTNDLHTFAGMRDRARSGWCVCGVVVAADLGWWQQQSKWIGSDSCWVLVSAKRPTNSYRSRDGLVRFLWNGSLGLV